MSRYRLPRSDSFGSLASTFSDASDFSEPSHASGDRGSSRHARAAQLGTLAGAIAAQERGIKQLNTTGEAFATACSRYEATLNAALVGPEPEIEAKQEVSKMFAASIWIVIYVGSA